MHACRRSESLDVALPDYTEAGWMGPNSQDALPLFSKGPAVVAMAVMSSSVEWRQVKQHSSLNDLEKPHWEKKSQAEQKEEYQSGIYTDAECCTHCLHTCIHTVGTCCCAI